MRFIRYSASVFTLGGFYCTNIAFNQSDEQKKSRLIFLGTGCSIGTPFPKYIMRETTDPYRIESQQTSINASIGDPRYNKDYRCNPSLLISYLNIDNNYENIIIDVGKTFRESLIRWFPKYKINSVDAVILSHGHADAIFGLDDIRGVQFLSETCLFTPIYLTKECLKTVKRIFCYLFPSNEATNSVFRFVSSIQWNEIIPHHSFRVCTLDVYPIDVKHGEDLDSMGFIFGKIQQVCYISDISRMPENTLRAIKSKGIIDILIVDSLGYSKHPTHFSLSEAVELARDLRPKKTYLVGMGSSIDHTKGNLELRKYLEEGLDIELAYDGLCVEVNL